MPTESTRFREANLFSTPIRDLGLRIEGTRLEPILAEFDSELQAAGLGVRPRFYLSTEWGVPFETISIAIPFYLAHPDLTALQAERQGYVEGFDRADILRYLRHEMGHVVSYAYKLYEDEEWVRHFGSITQPYHEDYRPEPFSRRHVHHLPGWYAQKHPDEDWAETFAVWMTPNVSWRSEYAAWPVALDKLSYCDRTIALLRAREPVVTDTELDEDVGDIEYSLEHYYKGAPRGIDDMPPGLDGALRTIFEDLRSNGASDGIPDGVLLSAAELIRRIEPELMSNVFRWTGHFPERTRTLVGYLADRAAQLEQGYPRHRETAAAVALTALVTGLAMTFVQHGSYLP